MAKIQTPQPVKYIAGLLMPNREQLGQVRQELESLLGEVDLVAPVVPFEYTDYYEREMGSLVRTYIAFAELQSPQELVRFKVLTNQVEDRWRRADGGRSINIDPGYLSLSQLVLASTKPFSHRIYLDQGIWAEVTLRFQNGTFESLPWTYPDYRAHIPLFNEWRNLLKNRLRSSHPAENLSIEMPDT